ncbi:DNA damage-inducible protein DnaD [Sporosarcina sp. NCCP-2716]|uniref:DnaD domain-containing protein n=1 Tax=Sporosarcina sp. NCCP-2716 TaxID=2943679 RepID=UPI00203A3E73|nr:DnaD domain protein [Sporosarcina sp. NCCP-2716]GKV70243.1 DNA damage-inducible protein DnaD [Sporosarcina sp. NCCP-2716]
MNYIKELNAFYDWLELNSVRPSTVILWHSLMHLNNKSGWAEEFTVARSVIEAKTGLKKDAYYTARNQLKQLGRIDFKERGTKATSFRMIPFSSEKQTTTQTITQTTDPTTTQTTTPTVTKQNETKRNETRPEEGKGAQAVPVNPFVFYEREGFGTLSSFTGDLIGELIDRYHEVAVLAAMKEAVTRGARNLKYVEAILKNPNKGKPANNVHPFTQPAKPKQDEYKYDYGF